MKYSDAYHRTLQIKNKIDGSGEREKAKTNNVKSDIQLELKLNYCT